MSSILWRRLDVPGHDACRLERVDGGWRLAGVAVFRHERGSAQIAYELVVDERWTTRAGIVSGWVGDERVDVQVRRSSDGAWTLGDRRVRTVDGCAHLDFGFTPATNLPQLRALDLGRGASAACPVAWLDVPACALERIEQRYERVAEDRYAYESPRFGYSATLVTGADGFVKTYPGLWEAEM
jgi:hypothetical protein